MSKYIQKYDLEFVDSENYKTNEGRNFNVLLFHRKYARNNEYQLLENNKVLANGKVPITYKPINIFNYWVRDEGTVQTFKRS